ncbi:TIGR01212 family radical SAM protein [Geobacter hydrogenophilus]|uniref:TIGR01212 family radical SAM protein n=1 Tax=Geobacter hydrogenophilus TaxID=40983 RepID=A0A9W6FYY4_9BACT|nr:TIGR01212 family radical SAM protein [Geobacter hydrogenophilus]MBT0893648.1 TIGR01212 family radical SAM protein [Geobacter hydrogenophilus]GLI37655.1 TIGR01212 family radical SAM protein [Geobacter hydrogenophilus]
MTERRYTAFADELRRVFGCRVQRISVDAGFTCPNRDGTAGTGGCIFCGGKGSGSFGIRPELSVTHQLLHGKDFLARRYGAAKFLAYFQAYSNTYAPVERLRLLYDEALAVPDVAGLIVGTRPDCLPSEVLDLLAGYARRTYFWLELGLQSPLDRTLISLNRGHDFASFVDAVARSRERGIRVCAHVILGLPGESREEMVATAEILNGLGVEGVKLHQLHVMKGTVLEEMYRQGEGRCLERDAYVDIVCDFLARLDPRIVIHRLVGDAPADQLVAPDWSLRKGEVLDAVDAELERRGTRQGAVMRDRGRMA